MSRKASSRGHAWSRPWVRPGGMTQATSYAARQILQPGACQRTTSSSNCVPLNVFGGAGSITEEQLAYVMPRALTNTGTNEQQYAEFVLSGPGGQLLERDVRWVLGADYRREAGSLSQDPLHALEFDTFGISGQARWIRRRAESVR